MGSISDLIGTVSNPPGSLSRSSGSASYPATGGVTTGGYDDVAWYIQQNALVHFNASSIVGSAPVTALTNLGTGGSAYSMTVIGGTGANLTRTTVNGIDAVNAAGSAYMETASGQTIASGAVVFAVAQFTNAAPGAVQFIFGPRTASGYWMIYSFPTNGNRFTIYQGGAVENSLTQAYDTNLHVFTGEFAGSTASKLTVSGLGSITGVNIGTGSWNFGTLFSIDDGSGTFVGNFCELIVLPTNPGATIIAAINAYLAAKWGAVT